MPNITACPIGVSRYRLLQWYCVCLVLLGLGVSVQAQDRARRIDGYRGIWFTLGQFYGPGGGGRGLCAGLKDSGFSLWR